jgi:hypothetical protein
METMSSCDFAAAPMLKPAAGGGAQRGVRSSEFFDARDVAQVKHEVRRARVDGAPVTAAGAFGTRAG